MQLSAKNDAQDSEAPPRRRAREYAFFTKWSNFISRPTGQDEMSPRMRFQQQIYFRSTQTNDWGADLRRDSERDE